jgi:ELWxxDGT repeat protein
MHGTELWRSDGTPEGTFLVKDIFEGSISSGLWYLTNMGDTLYFTASDGASGYELWRSDGTAEGTALVYDILPGSASSFPSFFSPWLTDGGTVLFFVANDDVHGRELWRSDGTTEGTALVYDIWPGAESAAPGELAYTQGVLFFAADDGTHGRELWRSDSTAAGTLLIHDIFEGSSSADPSSITSLVPSAAPTATPEQTDSTTP